MMQKEIWKDIKGYEGKYAVRNTDGAIYSYNSDKILAQCLIGKNRNYLAVSLYKDGKGRTTRVHRIVAETFIPNPDNLPEVNHIDENTLNNGVDNLEWCTKEDNIQYSLGWTIQQQDKEGKVIAEFPSIRAVERALGVSISTIRKYVNSEKEFKGYYWKKIDKPKKK